MSEEQKIDPRIQETIRAAGREVWRSRMADYERTFEGPPKRLWLRRNWLGVAAAVVLIMGAAWMTGLFSTVEESLYSQYFEPYPAPAVFRGQNPGALWQSASAAYQNEQYELAATGFNQLVENGQFQPSYLAQFYAALAMLAAESQDLERVQQHLQAVLVTDNDFQLPAQWYLALTHLQMGEQEQAKDILQGLKLRDDYRAAEAYAILTQIDK